MGKRKKIIYLVSLLSLVLVGVLIGIVIFIYNNINKITTYSSDTTIANISVGGLYYNEARSTLSQEAFNWQRTAKITLTYQKEAIASVNPSIFSININRSIHELKDGQNNKLYVDIIQERYPNYFETLLADYVEKLQYSQFDLERLQADLLRKVEKLNYMIEVDLGAYIAGYEDYRKSDESIIKSITLPNLTQNEMQSFLQRFTNLVPEQMIILPGKSQFSLLAYNQSLIETHSYGFNDQELSLIGTGIYELILYTNFQNIHKHISDDVRKKADYAKDGFEVLINTEAKKDFTFYNPNPMPYYIKITTINNQLTFELRGVPFLHEIEIIGHDEKSVIPAEYIYSVNKDQIEPIKIVQAGVDGFRIIIWRKTTVIVNDEEKVYLDKIYEDIYNSKPHYVSTNSEANR